MTSQSPEVSQGASGCETKDRSVPRRSAITRRCLSLAAKLLVIYLAVVILAFGFQRWLVYPAFTVSAAEFKQLVARLVPGAEVMPVFDAVLMSPPASAGAPRGVAIWFHGNGGMGLHRVAFAPAFLERGWRLVLAEYPGYGARAGEPSEAGLVDDALQLVAALRQRFPGEPLMLVGESLGSGVAVQVAKRLAHDVQRGGPATRLVLTTPYTSLSSVDSRQMPVLPARYLLLDRYDSIQHIASVPGPVAVLVASRDEVLGPEEGRALARSARSRGPVSLLEVNASHNTWHEAMSAAHWDQLLGL